MESAIHTREVHDGAELAKINFLVTADSFLPHSGGSRVYYANLYKNLLAQYPDSVTLLTKKVPGWREYDAREANARFVIRRRSHPLPSWRYSQLPKALPEFLHVAEAIFLGDFDCLHCGDLFPQALNGILLRTIFHLPLLVFCHGDEISQTDQRRHQPKARNFVYKHADAVIAANQFAYDGLVRIGVSKECIHKLTPGVDLDQFRPGSPNQQLIQRYGLDGKKVLLTVARLVPRKGHRIVLQALPKVLREIPNLKYLIVGEGSEKNFLENIVTELGLTHAVSFVGDVPHQQICDFYNLCDVFAMVNRLEASGDVESFGMVFTEANAMLKPVIAGRSGGAIEAVVEGKTGFLVDPDSADAIANRLLLLLKNDDLCKRMGAAGRERVIQEFNWNSRATELRQISADLVAKRRFGDTRKGAEIF